MGLLGGQRLSVIVPGISDAGCCVLRAVVACLLPFWSFSLAGAGGKGQEGLREALAGCVILHEGESSSQLDALHSHTCGHWAVKNDCVLVRETTLPR